MNTEALRAAVDSYLKGRAERGQKRQTERGLRMALKGVRGLGPAAALAVIEKATAGGWLGWPAESAAQGRAQPPKQGRVIDLKSRYPPRTPEEMYGPGWNGKSA